MGFGSGELAFASDVYDQKEAADSSHALVLRWVSDRPAGRILDLGCSDGSLAAKLREAGHHVTGVDLVALEGVKDRVDRFVQADLEQGIPLELEGPFDAVLAADVLEHVRHPEQILDQIRPLLSPGGSVIASIPNFGHWYPRARVALGRFDYDRRGILDRDHVRFFTRRSFEQLVASNGYRPVRFNGTGLPLEVVDRGGRGSLVGGNRLVRVADRANRAAVSARPQLFAYQFLYELRPEAPESPDPIDSGTTELRARRLHSFVHPPRAGAGNRADDQSIAKAPAPTSTGSSSERSPWAATSISSTASRLEATRQRSRALVSMTRSGDPRVVGRQGADEGRAAARAGQIDADGATRPSGTGPGHADTE